MSHLAISNIAWTAEEDEDAYALLAKKGVRQIEIAPPRFFSDSAHVSDEAVETVLARLRQAGLQVVAFQAILFGKADLLLFDPATRPTLAFYLCKMASLCARLGAKTMVFGAPGNRRIPDHLPAGEAREVAIDFFRQIGACAAEQGVVFGIEANPAAYQCNFLTHAAEVIELVRAIDSPGVRWHLDAGELAMNEEKIEAVIDEGHDLICHTHLSEAMLAGFANPWPGHSRMVNALKKTGYTGSFSLERKRQPDGLASVAQAIDFAQSLDLR